MVIIRCLVNNFDQSCRVHDLGWVMPRLLRGQEMLPAYISAAILRLKLLKTIDTSYLVLRPVKIDFLFHIQKAISQSHMKSHGLTRAKNVSGWY